LTADMELAMDIVGKFEPSIVVSTLEKIYSYLMELPIYNCMPILFPFFLEHLNFTFHF